MDFGFLLDVFAKGPSPSTSYDLIMTPKGGSGGCFGGCSDCKIVQFTATQCAARFRKSFRMNNSAAHCKTLQTLKCPC
jgi:hypothetical protein